MNKKDLSKAELEIVKLAEEKGLLNNYFFTTTLERYRVQIRLLSSLEKSIKEHGNYVEKEYVKGRKNLTINPAVSEYNRTSTAANNTASTLINIIKSLSNEERPKKSRLEMLNDD